MTSASKMKRLDQIERRLAERDNASHLGTVVLIERTGDDQPPSVDSAVTLRPGRPSIRLERHPGELLEAFQKRCAAV